jgi:nucleoside-diphosphate-sugar epimerase
LRDTLLFGASGQVGSALQGRLIRSDPSGRRVRTIAHAELRARHWEDVVRGALPSDHPCDLVFAGGITNPRVPADELRLANVTWPQRIISWVDEATASTGPARFLTLGTVQERFPELCARNSYLASKLELGRWMRARAETTAGAGRHLHVRLHTLYGGPLKEHMFLGQMVAALRAGVDFRMSSGDQLREYHHVEDIAAALEAVLRQRWTFGPTLEISSGTPLQLAELARAVFRAFGAEARLQIAALPRDAAENTATAFAASPATVLPRSREALPAIIEYLREQVSLGVTERVGTSRS